MSRRILRRCAVCINKPVFNNEKLCPECFELYKDEMETPWMRFLIKDTNDLRNQEIVRSKHEAPLYAWKLRS